ncbi:MAG: ATP-grasp domain-containing protein [Rhodospirillales bacterium]|nr:ATP-grasp domain-containing protein [Rhodospirillales bacterium]
MKNKPLNILITAASRRVALIQGFLNAINALGIKGNVISTDVNPLSPGLYISDRHHYAPLTTDPGYLDRLQEICAEEEVSVIIPTIDDELVLMGHARPEFEKIGVNIIISPPRTSEICNDKWQTFQFFTEQGVPTPKTWLPGDLPNINTLTFPLFLKPRMGRGSVNTFTIKNKRELKFFLQYVRDPIVQEFLEGPEYTLDTFADFEGRILSVVPRHRLWVRSGVMDKGRTENKQELIDIGIDVAKKLNIVGPTNIQVKYKKDQPMVFEVNPRFSGGIPLTIASGADFPEWICRLMLGEHLEPRLGKFDSGLVMMSYEESIFRKMDVDGFDNLKSLIS